MNNTLEDTVRLVVEDFMTSDVLFTALDVSNAVKKVLPTAKHREVRDVVRSMFLSEIEPKNWARSPISVTLADGSTTEALLYHPLSDSWDLDSKYGTQSRVAISYNPVAAAQTTVAQAGSTATTTPAPVASPAPIPMPNARALWDQMFATQPSLFPRK